MFQAQKLSASFARRPLSAMLLCAGLVSSPLLMSQAAAATAVQTTASNDARNVTIRIPYNAAPTWVRV
ncbi:hypothetical protein, partial [Massilia sp.]|uniref:hypothetical protein n=1 Tax=Massilia sp. TaxID=1882437 RepID=UPI00289A2DC3